MIRYRFLENLVLKIYAKMDRIVFPINPKEIVQYIPNCRYLSYNTFATINNCSIQTVISICESISGCVQYDANKGRYLIICNEDPTFYGNTLARQRWTSAHEIAHILCNHFYLSKLQMISENNLMKNSIKAFEKEADAFASILLAPFPLFKVFNINSPQDIQYYFGLSKMASGYMYNSFLKWKTYSFRRAWDNDIVNIYNEKL